MYGLLRVRNACACLFLGALVGCVPPGVLTARDSVKANDVPAAYVATTQYDAWGCEQIAAEFQKTSTAVAEMGGKLERGEYDNSGTLIVTPFFLFYDDTKALDATPQKAEEFGRLKGTLVALQQAAVKRNCRNRV